MMSEQKKRISKNNNYFDHYWIWILGKYVIPKFNQLGEINTDILCDILNANVWQTYCETYSSVKS